MILQSEDFVQIYEAIKQDTYDSEERKVIIFVSTLECDSVCAVRILQGLLQNDGIHFSIFPVASYSQVRKIFETQLNRDEELKNVILINCGAQEEVTKLLNPTSTTRIIVVDSHRPINHHFAAYQQEVACIVQDEDDTKHSKPFPEPDGASDLDSDDEAGIGADDLSGDEKENEEPQKRRRTGRDPRSPAGDIIREARKARRKGMRQRRKDYYAGGTYWGKPAALTMFRLAQNLRQDDNHFMWLAAVALTDQLVHLRIAHEKYLEFAADLETEMTAAGNLDAAEEVKLVVEDADGGTTTATVRKPITRTMPANDFRFTLMRHWSLYEAMLHSTHVAVRLQTWADKGRRTLEELLAKMGFRLKDCKLDYCQMKIIVQRQLESKLSLHAPTYRLSDLVFRSFQLQWGYTAPLMATDTVYAVTALLESQSRREGEEASASEAFWQAWAALNPGMTEEIKLGIDLSKRLQRAILSDGGLIIVRKDVHIRTRYSYVDLSQTEITNKTLLSEPLALLKMAIFLREQHAWLRPNQTRKPFVIIGAASSAGKCMVVSVAVQPTLSSTQGDDFGRIFQLAAKEVCADFHHDGFNTSVIELDSKLTMRFMDLVASIVYEAK